MWALWCKSFGPKCEADDLSADICCICRTARWALGVFIVGCFIVAGNVRHW